MTLKKTFHSSSSSLRELSVEQFALDPIGTVRLVFSPAPEGATSAFTMDDAKAIKEFIYAVAETAGLIKDGESLTVEKPYTAKPLPPNGLYHLASSDWYLTGKAAVVVNNRLYVVFKQNSVESFSDFTDKYLNDLEWNRDVTLSAMIAS